MIILKGKRLKLTSAAVLVRLSKILAVHVLLIACWVYLVDVVFELREFDNDVENGFKNSPVVFLISAILIAPLWEETVFRLPLKTNEYMWIAVGLGLFLLLGLELLALKILAAVYLLLVCLYGWRKKPFLKYAVVAVSVLLFGLVHLENYAVTDVEKMNWIELVASFLSQLALGIVITVIRMKYPFRYTVFYHGAFNAILVVLYLIFEL
jgi:hypothetical protein